MKKVRWKCNMGYYHIKNIKIDKKGNKISADLADSNWYPIDYVHVEDLCDKKSFEEKYANFIYNVVVGNYHPNNSNKFSRLVMNYYLDNYYDDAHDIGEVETYNKYKDVINSILTYNSNKIVMLESDREINPEKYYVLKPIELNVKYEGDYYANQKGEIYNYNNGKLSLCDNSLKNYGYPLSTPYHNMDKFIKYNDFLLSRKTEKGIEI